MKKGFTLIELLVVIAIIAILLAVLLPALSAAQGSARLIKSQANLRSMAQIHELYSGEYRGSLINPFNTKKVRSGGGIGSAGWASVRKQGLNGYYEFTQGNGNTNVWYSELYAFHWYSLIGGWLSSGDYASEVQFSPSDTVLRTRFDLLQESPPRGWSLDTGIWDCSYVLSPTCWFSPERYRDDHRGPAPKNNAIVSKARRNDISDVTYPSQKVLMWERFDWTKKSRVASYRDPSIAGGQAVIFGNESLPPQWNNYDAEPSVATADGSVTRVKMENIFSAMTDENERTAESFSPTDDWDCKWTALREYSMHEDGFEIGDPRSGMGKYPAFFWATRDGVQGRDFAR